MELGSQAQRTQTLLTLFIDKKLYQNKKENKRIEIK